MKNEVTGMIKVLGKIHDKLHELDEATCGLPEKLSTKDECLKYEYNTCYTIINDERLRCVWRVIRSKKGLERLSRGDTGDITDTVARLKDIRDDLAEMKARLTWLTINLGITEKIKRKNIVEMGRNAEKIVDKIQKLLSKVRDPLEELYLDMALLERIIKNV